MRRVRHARPLNRTRAQILEGLTMIAFLAIILGTVILVPLLGPAPTPMP